MDYFLRWVIDHTNMEQAMLSAIVALVLLGAAITQSIGVHAVLGAFVMGILLRASPLVRENVISPIESMTTGLLAPIFFATAGFYVNLNTLVQGDLLFITLVLTALACLGRIGGCYLGGRMSRLGKWESLCVGFGSNARGAMGLIIAILGLN